MKTITQLWIFSILWAPAAVLAETEEAASSGHSFGSYLFFWSGAVVLMYLMGRWVFREQLGERRTLRRLIDEIGPVYVEFDIDSIKQWVFLCAPHVWSGWSRGVIDTIDDFATASFLTGVRAELGALELKGLRRDARLEGVLKVHPLDLAMVGEGPPPANVQLTLRIEFKARDCIRNSGGDVVSGSEKIRQVQYFWTLIHDGFRWRLDRVWPAEEEFSRTDRTGDVPPVTAWRRAEVETEEEAT